MIGAGGTAGAGERRRGAFRRAARPGRFRFAGLSVLAALALVACDRFPRDPGGTLEAARAGTLRVGVTEAPPWIVRSGDEAGGPEAELVRSFAASIGARPEWVWGGADENLARLERRELALVAAGLTQSSPWNGRVALTRPHATAGKEKHVLAAPPGENALLVALERHIRSGR